ncbi:hypothetical protein [Neomoorella thermoacetica]|uniref:hypothetical protein n=1 Tax=Neomoorella thermoacetica TaxID=1525 RepID=UPI0018C876AC|nr:hypothetical protein [Moorella thermoacetica]
MAVFLVEEFYGFPGVGLTGEGTAGKIFGGLFQNFSLLGPLFQETILFALIQGCGVDHD